MNASTEARPVALVTGAASLIGQAVVRKLGGDGHRVIATDIEPLEARASDGSVVGSYVMDVTDQVRVSAVVDEVATSLGRLDVAVSCAGGLRGLGVRRLPLEDVSDDDWRRIVDTNLFGVMHVAHAAAPIMRAQRRGSIISIVASRGLRGGPNASHYSAAKAGVIVFSQCMALELASYGVRVNTVAPGSTEARWKTPDQDAQQGPLGTTSADDVGEAARWLASSGAKHVTGTCLDVSGGSALH